MMEARSPDRKAYHAELHQALVVDLYDRCRASIPALLAALMALRMVIDEVVDRPGVAAVFYGVVALNVVRLLSVFAGWRGKGIWASHRLRFWLLVAGAGLTSLGCAGLNILTLHQLSPGRVGLVALFHAGVISTAIASLGSSRLAYGLFAGPNLISLAVMGLTDPRNWGAHAMVVLVATYMVTIVVIGLQQYRSRKDQMLLALELRDLALTHNLAQLVRERYQPGAEAGSGPPPQTPIKEQLRASLDRLYRAQQQLIELSRSSGMAEVTTAVLHSIGNVLNSVNISAEQLARLARGSHLEHLARAAGLLREHEADLATFLREDPRGARLPQYFSLLAEQLAGEQRTIQGETQQLQKSVEHIKAIIAAQQRQARVSEGMREVFSLKETVEDAIRLNLISDRDRGIVVVRDHAELAEVHLDRHRLFQILVNLLSNARQAVEQNPGEKQIVVRTRRRTPDHLVVHVEDNGCGISAEAMPRLFNYGFTTKPDGHGFGLHSSALAARELGGH